MWLRKGRIMNFQLPLAAQNKQLVNKFGSFKAA